jgi:hypothetical protein
MQGSVGIVAVTAVQGIAAPLRRRELLVVSQTKLKPAVLLVGIVAATNGAMLVLVLALLLPVPVLHLLPVPGKAGSPLRDVISFFMAQEIVAK